MTTVNNIPALVNRLCAFPRETEWFEFKSNDAKPERLGQNISAIANAAAISEKPHGYIIWGVQDENHRIIGTTFNPAMKRVRRDDLEHWLSNRLKPSVNFRFHKDIVNGKNVVVLVIPHAFGQPVRFENEAYIRIGSHTRKLRDFPEKERVLWHLSEGNNFENGIAIEDVNDADVLRLLDHESYFRMVRIPTPANILNQLQCLERENFIHKRDDGMWNILNLGFLSFAQNLEDVDSLRYKSVRVVKYSGSARYNGSRQEEFYTGYASGFSSMIDLINNLAPTDENFNGGIRKQESRFPILAIREVVANALIHQDLSVSSAGPLVEIFDNRIEVLNPGRPLVDSKQFINAPPKSRNKTLAKLFRRSGICEELGSGWDKIVYEIENRQLPAPRIDVIGDSTRVTIYAAIPLSEMDSEDRVRAVYLHACLKYTNSGTGITNTTVRQRFGLSESKSAQASRILTEALVSGDIVPRNANASRKFMQYIPYWAGD